MEGFDTADYEILFGKLSLYGIKDTELEWFSTYLGNRCHCCKVSGITSSVGEISCSVPQVSYLGPLLFLLYINDLPCGLKCCKVAIYEDYTSLAYLAKDIKGIANIMNSELENLKVRLYSNKLSLNVAKITSMLIGTEYNNEKITADPVRASFEISGDLAEQKSSVRYLGVDIDSKLEWKDRIKTVALKVTRIIAMIRYSKKFILNIL